MEKKKLKTSLPLVALSTLTIHVGVPVSQIRSQLDLATHPTPDSQHLGWQQLVTPLIVGQLKVVPYPPYPTWYSVIPPFIPMDSNMYSMYYSRIKRT